MICLNILITLYFASQLVVDGCGSLVSASANEDETFSCNNLAQYLVHEDQFEDLVDLLTYDRELVLTEDANGWNPLHEAAKTANPLIVYLLVVNGVDPLVKTKLGHTALEILKNQAILPMNYADSYRKKRFLLSQRILEEAEKGKDLNGNHINRETMNQSSEVILKMPGLPNGLVFFGLKNELEQLYYLNNDTINESDPNGWTPLIEAVRNENVDIIRFLIDSGADVFKKANDGQTAFSVAKLFARSVKRETLEEIMNLLLKTKESQIQLKKMLR